MHAQNAHLEWSDDMASFYPLLTLVSMVVFAWLGRRMAPARGHSRLAWGIGVALLPPAPLVLWILRPIAAKDAGETPKD